MLYSARFRAFFNFQGPSFLSLKGLWIAFFCLNFLFASDAFAQANKRIQKIRVLGNKRIEAEAILEKMSLKTGKTLDSKQVRKDILSIFKMGYFQDVRFQWREGNQLWVRLKERPVIADIQFEGNSEFEDSDLLEAVNIENYRVLNLSEVRTAERAIEKKYEEKGYYLARARFETEVINAEKNEVRLKFFVQEGNQVKIRKIFFIGNKVFPSSELKRIMFTSEGHAFSWMSGGGTYREDFFERDLAALAYFYSNEGYLEAKFTKPRVTLSQDRRYIDILMKVEEGRQFFLESVDFRGDIDFSQEELKKSLGMKEGDVFSTGKLQKGVLALTDLYGDKGYAFANVVHRPQPRQDSKVDLLISIQKGVLSYWGRVNVYGNSKTHDKVIRRELLFSEGELYNATKKKKSFARVRRLGYFGESVKFSTRTRKGTEDVIDLDIAVEEKATGTLNVSAGYGTGSNFVFGGNLSQNNLMGLGRQLRLSVNLASNEASTFSLSYTDPKINDSEWLFGVDMFRSQRRIGPQSEEKFTYLKKTTGAYLRFGRALTEDINLIGRYRLTYAEHDEPISDKIFTRGNEDRYTLISSISTDLVYDTRNNRLDPSAGSYLSGSAEFGGLGGRVFQSLNFSARYYKKLFWKLVYRGNMNYAALFNVFDEDNVPDSERFVIGGITSLRGYDPASLGTRRILDPADITRKGADTDRLSYVIGGTQKFVFNQEVEFPLIPEANIRAVFFFDLGNSWDSVSDVGPFLLSNYGWGVRWYSPMGPLRFEWGYPIVGNEFNPPNKPVFHFMIAPTF